MTKKFIKKRIREQIEYIFRIHNNNKLPAGRKEEILKSARGVQQYFTGLLENKKTPYDDLREAANEDSRRRGDKSGNQFLKTQIEYDGKTSI